MREERFAGQRGDDDVFVGRVSSVSDRAEPVESRGQSARQVCVGCSTDERGLVDVQPQARASRWARRKRAWLRSVAGIGGRKASAVMVTVVPCFAGLSERIACATAFAAASLGARTSTSAVACGATTFALRPPSIVPTLTVTPSGVVQREELLDLAGQLEDRADPSSGFVPACAARPLTTTLKRSTPLRPVFSDPAVPRAVRARMRGRRPGEQADVPARVELPISSSELTNSTGATAGSKPSPCSAASAKTSWTSPPFMSYVPGP